MRATRLCAVVVVISIILCAIPLGPVIAAGAPQWPVVGAQVSSGGVSLDSQPVIVSEGEDAVILAWTTTDSRVLVQKLDGDGNTLWATGGVAVCPATAGQSHPAMISDGSGGVFVTWQDGRAGANYDIYAQRILSTGARDWNPEVPVCSFAGSQYEPEIVTDGSGGMIISWKDARSLADGGVYAQRLNASGAVQWNADGACLCKRRLFKQHMVADGSGGAIVAWEDVIDDIGSSDIYAQKVDGSGNTAWAGIVPVCTSAGNQIDSRIATDGAGGAVMTWDKDYTGIYAQRLDSTGATAWGSNGVLLSASGVGSYPSIAPDGASGAIVTWRGNGIRAQRVNASGAPQWTAGGIAVTNTEMEPMQPVIVSDNDGGAIISWSGSTPGSLDDDLYAQRLDPDGICQWAAGSIQISADANRQYMPALASYGTGNAFISWIDYSDGSTGEPGYSDLYCQKICSDAPETPKVTYPQDGSVFINRNPDLRGSSFINPPPDEDIHLSEWQVDNNLDFSSPEWTGRQVSSENMVVTQESGQFANDLEGRNELAADSVYYARVRYQNDSGVFSDYSPVSAFVTDSNEWYLAEGCTAGGFETWVLIENVDDIFTTADLSFQTENGLIQGPNVVVPAGSRVSVNIGQYVTSYDVSTRIACPFESIVCERAMYGNDRAWGHDSLGITHPNNTWYMAEGCTAGGFETWVLVQNPEDAPVEIDMDFQTDSGPVQGPQETIPANSRKSYDLRNYVDTYDVSTKVTSTGGNIICERAMYGNDRAWGHDSVGVTQASRNWIMAEGCTAGGFETWVLVQNPGPASESVDMFLSTESGVIQVLDDYNIPAFARTSFNIGDFVEAYDVSTMIFSSSSDSEGVICERAMYGNDRAWGHDSVGSTSISNFWALAEGCTAAGGSETWLLMMNPFDTEAVVDIFFLTENGPVQGPVGYIVNPMTRVSLNVGDYVESYDVATLVYADQGAIVCERSMYGNQRTWGTNSIGYMPDNPEFSATFSDKAALELNSVARRVCAELAIPEDH